eukprot:3378677-Rhodomonas_salina.1
MSICAGRGALCGCNAPWSKFGGMTRTALVQHDNSVDAALDALLAAKAEEEARSGPADYEPEHLPSERSNRS